MTKAEIQQNYEYNTGKVIIEMLSKNKVNPINVPAILVSNHGPFIWGEDTFNAIDNAIVLEQLAKMNFLTHMLDSKATRIEQFLLDKHFLRKHGKKAYYGQKNK